MDYQLYLMNREDRIQRGVDLEAEDDARAILAGMQERGGSRRGTVATGAPRKELSGHDAVVLESPPLGWNQQGVDSFQRVGLSAEASSQIQELSFVVLGGHCSTESIDLGCFSPK
jgi:hypothetical protein